MHSSIIEHDYNGSIISQRPDDGYVSLTTMAQANGKRVNDYLRLNSTIEYLEELSRSTGIPAATLIDIRMVGINDERGTWGHPEIATDFAQWCNIKFRVWANKVLRGVVQGTPATSNQKSLEEIVRLCNGIKSVAGQKQSTAFFKMLLEEHHPELAEKLPQYLEPKTFGVADYILKRLEKMPKGEAVTVRTLYLGVTHSKKLNNASTRTIRAKCRELAGNRPNVFFENDKIGFN